MYPNLKLQLWKSGIRQNRLAKLLGIDQSLLSKIVNGFLEPSPDIRSKTASVLGTDEEWLFESFEVELTASHALATDEELSQGDGSDSKKQ